MNDGVQALIGLAIAAVYGVSASADRDVVRSQAGVVDTTLAAAPAMVVEGRGGVDDAISTPPSVVVERQGVMSCVEGWLSY